MDGDRLRLGCCPCCCPRSFGEVPEFDRLLSAELPFELLAFMLPFAEESAFELPVVLLLFPLSFACPVF